VVTLWGRRWTRPELLARVGRLEQVAGFEILVDRGFDIGGAWIGGVTIGNAAEIAGWGIDVIVSGSAIFDRVDPAGNLDLLTRQLRRTMEVPDDKR